MTTDELWELAEKVYKENQMPHKTESHEICNIFAALSQAYIAGMTEQMNDTVKLMNTKNETK